MSLNDNPADCQYGLRMMSKNINKYVPQGLQYLAHNITQNHNIMGSSAHDKASWSKGLKFPHDYQTIFFAGCGYQYSSDLKSMMSIIRGLDKNPIGIDLPARIANFMKGYSFDPVKLMGKFKGKDHSSDKQALINAVKILQALGFDYGYLSENEPCCGGILYYSGMERSFADNARSAYQSLKSRSIKEIISIVPSCTYTLKKLFPKYVYPFEIKVLHFLEAVAAGIRYKNLELPSRMKVTYHDPCQLSRFLQITHEPRLILESIKGIELIETRGTNREMSTCCGGGGGFEAVFPELSEKIACNRALELTDTGAEVIVTHCPGCILQIRHALKRLDIKNIEVMDITQIIAMAMRI